MTREAATSGRRGGALGRHALVVSIVHTPLDARIHYRQARALVDAGWTVTQAAPWTAYGLVPPPDVVAVDLPRAQGRQRLRAILAARRAVRRLASDADVVLLHDPELLLAVAFLRGRPATVWDVHEDTAGALIDKPWLPAALHPVVRPLVRLAERVAERRVHLILAEDGYTERFRGDHPVVPNHPVVPEETLPPGADRVVYVGRISRGRGIETILAVAHELRGEVEVELVGQADRDVEDDLVRARQSGVVTWHGFLPNDEALACLDGALAGLSLLRDEPNYRSSLPTKVIEYLSRGVPAITTPLPRAVEMVERHDAGIVVPFDDADAVVAAVRKLRGDEELRRGMGRRGHEAIRTERSWQADAPRFVAHLERLADVARSPS